MYYENTKSRWTLPLPVTASIFPVDGAITVEGNGTLSPQSCCVVGYTMVSETSVTSQFFQPYNIDLIDAVRQQSIDHRAWRGRMRLQPYVDRQ